MLLLEDALIIGTIVASVELPHEFDTARPEKRQRGKIGT